VGAVAGPRHGLTCSAMPAQSDDVVPVAEVLGTMVTEPLADGDKPLAAFLLVKSTDSDGDAVWAVREAGDGITSEELLGALTAYTEYLRRQLASEWEA
jgi:hypothetical protein